MWITEGIGCKTIYLSKFVYRKGKAMYDEVTEKDIQRMKEEIEYRKLVVRKEALEAVKEARAQGDLSENFEYHAAKKDKNQNEKLCLMNRKMMRLALITKYRSISKKMMRQKSTHWLQRFVEIH